MGALIGKASPFQFIVMAIFEIAVYTLNIAIVTQALGASDTGGSMTIHTFGAYFGLAATCFFDR